MAHLRFPNSGKGPVPLTDRIVVGRSSEFAQLVIEDKRLSRKHCEFVPAGSGWLVRDLGSANGVKVAGSDQKLAEHTLRDGDRLSLGGLVIEYHEGDPDAAPPDEKPTAVLRVIRGTLKTVLVRLDASPFVIGRKENCNLVLADDAQASQNHARLDRNVSGTWAITDLGSTNGIKVDGKPVQTAELRDGSRISIGSQFFQFQLSEDSPVPDAGPADSKGSSASTVFVPADGESGGPAELDLSADAEESIDTAPARKISRTGLGSNRLVKVLETAVILLVVGALGWFGIQLIKKTGEDGIAGPVRRVKPPGDGGLLRADSIKGDGNGSFEPREGQTIGVPGWTTFATTGDDVVSTLEDHGQGGVQVLRIRREAGNRGRTVVESMKFLEVEPGQAYAASVWLNRVSGNGSGFLSMRWFAAAGDASPLRTDVAVFTAGTPEWKQVSATFAAPRGAKAARFGVGYAGRRGDLLYDECRVEATEGAGMVPQLHAGTGFTLQLSEAGRLSLGSPTAGPMLLQGQIVLVGTDEGVEVLQSEWMSGPVGIESKQWTIGVFDPDVEVVRQVTLRLTRDGFDAILDAPAGTTFDRMVLRFVASQSLLQDGVEPAAFRNGRLAAYGSRLNEATGCEVRLSGPAVNAKLTTSGGFRQQGQVLEFHSIRAEPLSLSFSFDPPDKELESAMDRIRGTGGEVLAEADRLTLGLQMAVKWPLSATAVDLAMEAVEGSATWWRIRARELRDTVAAGAASTRDATRYLAAVDEAGALAVTIEAGLAGWANDENEIRTISSQTAYPDSLRAKLRRIMDSMLSLAAVKADLTATQAQGKEEAFRLRAARQRVAADPMFASAQDHFAQAELVQARLKFESLLRQFPNTYAATRARARLLDIAESVLAQRDAFTADGLATMATESQNKASELLAMVRDTSAQFAKDMVLDVIGRGAKPPSDLADWRAAEEAVRNRTAELAKKMEGR